MADTHLKGLALDNRPSDAIIQMKGVCKAFGGLSVLQYLEMTIQANEKIALIGASGCGKSTLLRCLNALERIDSGELTVNGLSLGPSAPRVSAGRLNRFRSHIGVVFQQFNLFPHLTVLQNITLGPTRVQRVPSRQATDRALALLERVGIASKAHAYPEQLSGGQKQRAAIARALAMRPSLLLMDEPTSALDPAMAREVWTVVRQTAQANISLVIATHDWRFIESFADRILFIEKGAVVEEGPPAQILYQPRCEATHRFVGTFR